MIERKDFTREALDVMYATIFTFIDRAHVTYRDGKSILWGEDLEGKNPTVLIEWLYESTTKPNLY